MTKYKDKVDLLVEYLRKSECVRGNRRIGIELEHFVVEAGLLEAVSYYQKGGIEDLLKAMAERGWDPEIEGGHVLGLEGDKAGIDLEPGGQLELSIFPQESIQTLEEIYLDFVNEVTSILDGWGNNLICLGYQPTSSVNEIPMLPKERYDYMYDYFGNKGKYAYNMMKSTCAIHVNLDYFDEEDYVKKNLVANALSPLVYTVLDNSPFFEGKVNEEKGLRRTIWENCDPNRCGHPVGVFSKDFGYRDYAKYLLNTAPMVYKRGEELIYSKDKLLKDILLEELDPTGEELEYLLTTVFPDVRTKGHLEIRTGDSLPYPYSFAYLCFWKGLLYNRDNLDILYERFRNITDYKYEERKKSLNEKGVEANWEGVPVFSAYQELLRLAEQGLEPDEIDYIKPLKDLAEAENTPSGKTIEALGQDKADALAWCIMNEVINKKE